MSDPTILARPEVEKILRVTRQSMEQGSSVPPALFLRTVKDRRLYLPLSLPDTTEQRATVLLGIGCHLVAHGQVPHEALLLSESWFVGVQSAPSALKFPPSQHPSRQEALVVIGRSADNRRYTQVIQPFTRDKDDQPIWQPVPLAMYDAPRTAQDGPTGLLDFLFEGIPASP